MRRPLLSALLGGCVLAIGYFQTVAVPDSSQTDGISIDTVPPDHGFDVAGEDDQPP